MRYYSPLILWVFLAALTSGEMRALARVAHARVVASNDFVVTTEVPAPTVEVDPISTGTYPRACTDRDALETCGFQTATGHDCLNAFPVPTTAPEWCNPLPSNTGGKTCFCAYQQLPETGWFNADGVGIATEDHGLSFE